MKEKGRPRKMHRLYGPSLAGGVLRSIALTPTSLSLSSSLSGTLDQGLISRSTQGGAGFLNAVPQASGRSTLGHLCFSRSPPPGTT
jgi:hypothetical protein